jgi:hypothetical protein
MTVVSGAFAPYVIGVRPDIDNPGATNLFDVAINEDEFWDPTNSHEIGRTLGFVVQLVNLSGSTATVTSDSQYNEKYMGNSVGLGAQGLPPPSCPSGGCGWVFGVPQIDQPVDCGPPPSGMQCGPTNSPVDSCTPKTFDTACAANADGAQACAQVSDGCGGLIHCSACPSGQVCGTITAGYCGPPNPSPTAQQVRNAYGDVQNKLCGAFADPGNPGTVVTLAAPDGCTCPDSQICP